MKVLNAKLREKFIEALKAVLPIVAIVLILGFTIAPVTPIIFPGPTRMAVLRQKAANGEIPVRIL